MKPAHERGSASPSFRLSRGPAGVGSDPLSPAPPAPMLLARGAAAAVLPLAAAALAVLTACATGSSTARARAPRALPPDATTSADTFAASPPDSLLVDLSPEEARDLAAVEAEVFHGPVGSINEDLDEEIEDFLEDESEVLLSERVSYDIPIVMNERVHYFIDYFQNRVEKSFAKWLGRSSQFLPYLKKRFRQADMPEDLVYLALIESGFSPQARSTADAVGYWQFIASTARRYGLRVDRWVDERRDFQKSTEAAIAYLKDLHRMFGSWYLAAAAYNSGEKKIQRAIERYGSENLWELAEFSYLRAETKDYVPKLIAAILIAREPEQYGFTDIVYLPPVEADDVTVPTQTDFEVIASAAGTSVETIRALNPHLRAHATPPGVPDFEVRVPSGAHDLFEERYARVPASQRVVVRTHVVRRGESPGSIAARHGVSPRELMALNGIRNPRKLRVGQRLTLPRPAGGWGDAVWRGPAAAAELARGTARASAPAAPAREPAPAEAPSDLLAPGAPQAQASSARLQGMRTMDPTAGAEPEYVEIPASPVEVTAPSAGRTPEPARPARRSATRGPIRYRVKGGDTLYHIAASHGVTVADMERWNPAASSRITPGMILVVRPLEDAGGRGEAAREPAASRVVVPERTGAAPAGREAGVHKVVHRVRGGETLWSIARRYGVTLEDARRWNGIRGSRIRAGQRLVLYPGGS